MKSVIDLLKYNKQAIFTLLFAMAIVIYFISSMKKGAEEEKLTVKNVVGNVKYVRGENETILEEGAVVYCGGIFYTGKDSGATVIFDEGKSVEMLSNCTMEVKSTNSIDKINSMGGFTTVKSYMLAITKGEVIVDVKGASDNGFFELSTPELSYRAADSKTRLCRKDEYGVSYITVDRGKLEIETSSRRELKEGDSIYSTGDKTGNCSTMTLEKKDAYVFSYIENGKEERYEIYSEDRVGESNTSNDGERADIHDLELAQRVYDKLDKIYTKASAGETTIDFLNLDGEYVTVHIIENNNGVLTFDPIDRDGIYFGLVLKL